jgi:serine/threonine protein kinase
MIGQVISRYRIVAELGSGGMGVVYRAEDLTLHREVGLKILAAGASSNVVARFLREARAAASLNHPNICTVYDAGEHNGRPYIAMELLKGQTLRDFLVLQRLSIAEVLDMGAQIADGIAAAHAKGIIHRDIKPANIWVTEDRLVKILDFGLVKLLPGLARSSRSMRPSSERSRTCRRSRRAEKSSTRERICFRSAWCSTRCTPGVSRFAVRRRPSFSTPSSVTIRHRTRTHHRHRSLERRRSNGL